ncbi:ABC transporter permease [Taibaiella sp. KBW10]|uniref:ABC transporter permease n=1 Tax=Taibaiella sp. KBW10 TaxID=2153357 RepID=UPI001315A5B0|nr:ABC transporter permease [Taibaiella sp. KBW10]
MKTGIIIKREYLTRVKKRSFIITTLLLPLLFIAFSALTTYLTMKSSKVKTVTILDESQYFINHIKSTKNVSFEFSHKNLDSLKRELKDGAFDALVYVPAIDINKKETLTIFSNEQPGTEVESELKEQMNDLLINERLKTAGIDQEKYKAANEATISFENKVGQEEKKSNSAIASGISTVSGFLLYFFMLLYGMSVMRSVMEEKTNRIAEIIISSVKPFQLMMGKIVGVALVGLTQVLIWVVFLGAIFFIFSPMMTAKMNISEAAQIAQSAQGGNTKLEMFKMISSSLGSINWLSIVAWFLFYFLGGYFLYAALFAAVGSLVNEDQQDAQQFTTIITLPIIFSFFLMTAVIRDPNSGMAVFGSIFPLTSPIVMMARIPFGVPAWQLIASAVCLVVGFILTTKLAGKIYRTGILMYGKKITMKEVGKWIFRKG